MIQRYAIDGPVVVVPARAALLLEKALKLDDFRMQHRGRDDQVDAVLTAWHAVAMQYVDEARDAATSRIGSSLAPASEVPAPLESVVLLGASEVARDVGVTTRAVTLAANGGRLRGELFGGRWWFRPEDVRAWAETRAA